MLIHIDNDQVGMEGKFRHIGCTENASDIS
jgi:hypothetical protein